MTNPPTTSDTNIDFSALRLQLTSGSEKVQQQLIHKLATLGNAGLDVLMEFLLQRRFNPPSGADGTAYQILCTADSTSAKEFLQTYFPTGIVPLHSDRAIDYIPLQQLLAVQDFQAADRMTLQKLCELAGSAAVQRKWLYFTEVENFPIPDLQTINTLWVVHSEGKFGFSIQREIWLSQGKNWEKFWTKIGWKNGNSWTRYPNEFTWNLTAPPGHLPLSNQLRGNRVIAGLFSHPAWEKLNT
ncbi:GUN4 domain-containing protein [Chroococcidiopsis sp. CCMEE 29]|uniref:GUN4 domain-containing protein n=1 Tax=Chroococcidiopsis sp. CCMEE 29 TaxID=155894 RepID=UPI002021F9F7|nr:GUN4 domain-containing protein [Chroococcidiopsis sp. CCMEE 29]